MRLMPLVLPLLTLPWLAAAPVPKGPPPFGPVLTADQLSTLPFVDADPQAKDGDSSETRNARSVAVAVHLPRTRYEEGDPIPALFAVKNRADKPHGLWMRLDFASRMAHGAADIEVRNTATDARSSPFSGQSTMCGGPRGEIPAKGYFAVRGDIGRHSDGKPLPVGEFELRWTYAGVRSKSVPFSVVGRRLGRPDSEAPRRLSLWRLDPGEDEALAPVSEADFAHAFQAGEFGAHFPDVREIPAERGGLTVSVKWAGNKLTVTLDSPHQEFTELGCRAPVVYLMIERAGVGEEGEACTTEKKGERKDSDAEANKLPLKLSLRLPNGWKDSIGATGECRVAVVVTSREPPERASGERLQHRMAEIAEAKIANTKDRQTKTGDWVLKTEWQPLPKAPPK